MKQCLTVCALTIEMPAPAHYAGAQALTPAQLALKAKVEGVPDIPLRERGDYREVRNVGKASEGIRVDA